MRALLLGATVLIDIERHSAELDSMIGDSDDVAVATTTDQRSFIDLPNVDVITVTGH